MSNWFKKNGVHFAILLFFVILCFIYFSPAFQGKVLIQHDVSQATAMQQEIRKFKEQEGVAPLWTNAMFGGMPAYQISTTYPKNVTTYILYGFRGLFPNPVDMIMLYLIGGYLLFNVLLSGLGYLKRNTIILLSLVGAIAFAFSSYNFIIIEAGHGNKALAIGFFAPILAGIILTLRGKLWLGAGLTALFLALEIRANHVQMTYYLFIALLVLMGIELYNAYKNKALPVFGKRIAFLVASVIIAVAVNASMLWSTYEYGELSIRGKSNLTSSTSSGPNEGGLDKEYAYQWSQGIGESITFLIPNAYGGASGPTLDGDSEVAKTLMTNGVDASQATAFARQMPTYWGDKPFTSGPWYFGAILVFLFVLGLLIVKGPFKWWLLSATVLSLLLSFGRHFDLISNLFFDYFPLYNKFRAVESILVIASFCFPILGILGIAEILKPETDKKWLLSKIKVGGYIVGGLLIILWILPTLFFSFKAGNHQEFIGQLSQAIGDQGFANQIAQALIDDRVKLFRADALRSLFFVGAGLGIVWLVALRKINSIWAFSVLGLLVLADLWAVDKRYLNNEKFVTKQDYQNQWKPREVDEFIMRDPDPNYRVLDLSIPTFSSANATYFHKTVGGYHAAKLMRFQEVIENQFNGAINQDVLDMLNTKYFITADESNERVSMKVNETAAGHAWFVDNVLLVKDNNEEMAAIGSFNPSKEAIINDEFEGQIQVEGLGNSQNGSIKLVNYKPDHLTYEYTAAKRSLAVFSEIWYPKGWKLYVDGEEMPYIRANYILRAAQLPGGNHTLEWKFEPRSYYLGETIALIASILLILILTFASYKEVIGKREDKRA